MSGGWITDNIFFMINSSAIFGVLLGENRVVKLLFDDKNGNESGADKDEV